MSTETQEKVANETASGEAPINGTDLGDGQSIPIQSNSDNSPKVDLDGNSDSRSREDLVKEIESLKGNNSKLEDSRRKLQSRTDVLTEQIVKNSQEASRLGLNVDDRGMPAMTTPAPALKKDVPAVGEVDEVQLNRIIDEKMQVERKTNLEEQIRSDVLAVYPDLKDPNSELYKEAEKVLVERPHLNSATHLRDIAQLSIFNLMQKNQPELEKQMKEKFFSREAAGAAYATAASSTSGGSGDQGEGLSDEQRAYYKGRDRTPEEMKRLEKVMRDRHKKGVYQIDVT